MREEKKLRVENAKLKKEIEELKQELIQAEIQNGGEYRNSRICGNYVIYVSFRSILLPSCHYHYTFALLYRKKNVHLEKAVDLTEVTEGSKAATLT